MRGLTEKKIASGSGNNRTPAKAQVAPAKDAASQMTGKDAVAPVSLMATPKPKPAKAAAEKAPELLKKPRTGKGDDLKLIWGVGPKLEKMLNGIVALSFEIRAIEAAWKASQNRQPADRRGVVAGLRADARDAAGLEAAELAERELNRG